MNKEQKLELLNDWVALFGKCMADTAQLARLVGTKTAEGYVYEELHSAIWGSFDFATDMLNKVLVENEVTRFNDWFTFFAFDCDMGNRPQPVTKPSGESRLLSSLDDLLWAIEND